jgi:hypothetical protein
VLGKGRWKEVSVVLGARKPLRIAVVSASVK